MKNFVIKKRCQDYEPFDLVKLEKSLKKSGANKSLCNEVLNEIKPKIKDRSTSTQLFKLASRSLAKKSKVLAANYHLVRAIYELGPTGYPFEVLCAEMLKKKGFETEVGKIMQGQFVKHEVDVIATRDDAKVLCECKFHNKHTGRSNVKVPLYIHSRFLDILAKHGEDSYNAYAIFSNTTFSKDAITYAEGVNIKLFSMNYPRKDTFVDHIIRYKIYPITCLKSLKKRDSQYLLNKGIVVIKQLKENISYLRDLNLDNKEINAIQREINLLLKTQ
jgi:hypothetical protein